MNKADFLDHIANRLHRSVGTPPSGRSEVGVPLFWATRGSTSAERVRRFCERFTELGGEIERFQSEHAIAVRLEDILHELEPETVGAWGRDAAWTVDVSTVLDAWRAVRWDETSPKQFAQVQVGVTGCAFAIADTGTLAIKSSRAQGRGVHVLPSVHIVVMSADQIQLRLGDVLTELSKDNANNHLAASVHFVSGPSRSSDIENDQSIGVHGPARVIVLLLEAPSTATD